MLEAKTSSHGSAPRNRHTVINIPRYLALATENALRVHEFPITEQGRNLHVICAVGKPLQELKY